MTFGERRHIGGILVGAV